MTYGSSTSTRLLFSFGESRVCARLCRTLSKKSFGSPRTDPSLTRARPERLGRLEFSKPGPSRAVMRRRPFGLNTEANLRGEPCVANIGKLRESRAGTQEQSM